MELIPQGEGKKGFVPLDNLEGHKEVTAQLSVKDHGRSSK